MKQREFAEKVVSILADNDLVTGVAAGGSWLSGNMDEFSDLDLVIVTKEKITGDKGKMIAVAQSLGTYLSGFTGEHVGEPRLLICLYDNPFLHVDLKFVTPEEFQARVETPAILLDKEGLLHASVHNSYSKYPYPDYSWIEDRFWIWVHYALLKIGRGEYFEALDFMAYLRGVVLGPLLHIKNGKKPRGVRKVESDLNSEDLVALKRTVPVYDRQSLTESLGEAVRLYRDLRRELFGGEIELQIKTEERVMQYFNEICRDFASISPSAKWLLFMKGHTDIPFVRQAAELVMQPEKYIPDFERRDTRFWIRTMHFEQRYKSIDRLLTGIGADNILELSSGYSFRGLEMVKSSNLHYIDTDLPEVVKEKEKLVGELRKGVKIKGKLELLPLNVLESNKFEEITGLFGEGEIVIVNEGLLMYLDRKEKEILCRNVRNALLKFGGYWIVGDVYIRNKPGKKWRADSRLQKYYDKQNIEENKFGTFEEAHKFFKEMGFRVDKVSDLRIWELSSWRYVRKNISARQFFKLLFHRKVHATWRLSLQ